MRRSPEHVGLPLGGLARMVEAHVRDDVPAVRNELARELIGVAIGSDRSVVRAPAAGEVGRQGREA